MPGHVDRPPDLVDTIRELQSRIGELERVILNRIVAYADATRGSVVVPNATTYKIVWTSVTATPGVWSASAPALFTAAQTGVYIATGSVNWAAGSPGTRRTALVHNLTDYSYSVNADEGTSIQSLAGIFRLQQGDTIDLEVMQFTGVGLTLDEAFFGIYWVGRPAL